MRPYERHPSGNVEGAMPLGSVVVSLIPSVRSASETLYVALSLL